MTKLLLIGGCSFSADGNEIDPWPKHLYQSLQPAGYTECRNSARSSQGNGLISRGVIYNVTRALETHLPQDILVGVMWSGSNRHDFRCTDPDLLGFVTKKIHNNWFENPTGFVQDADKNWVILNHHWATLGNPEAEAYYRIFYDSIGATITSIEHVLRTQWFLKAHGIRYFFSNYIDSYLGTSNELQHTEVKYLYDQIDQSQYLPVTSEYSWVREQYQFWVEETLKLKGHPNEPYHVRKMELSGLTLHPETEHHKEFTDQVIMPWLQLKGYLPG